MRKINSLLVSIAVFISYSCGGGGEEPQKATIDIKTPEVTILNVKNAQTTAEFTSSATWNISQSELPTWLDVTPMNGAAGKIKITITATETYSQSVNRNVYIKINSGSTTKTIKVTQTQIVVDKSTVNFGASTNLTQSFTIDAGSDWNINVPAEHNWCTVTPNNGTVGSTEVTLTAAENFGSTDRKFTLDIKSGVMPKQQVEIFQAAIPPLFTENDCHLIISTPGNIYQTMGFGGIKYDISDGSGTIAANGISDWSDPLAVVSMFVKVTKAGKLNVGFTGSVPSGSSKIKVTVQGTPFIVDMTGSTTKFYPAGQITMPSGGGYVRVDFQGVSRTSSYFANIAKLRLGGEATTETNTWIKDNQVAEWYYWGRRGPSVHMSYTIPDNMEYFYNEITVPAGNDPIGAYFMTNGFGEGYCGIQVNSTDERRILFSVWSPWNTNNPGEIPTDYKVVPLRKGAGVTVGDFGGEGSGGQSYLKFMWKTGVTYKIITQVKYHGTENGVSQNNIHKTDYTAYFFDPEANSGAGKWYLIASFRRPYTNKSYTDAYSFNENFSPNTGWIQREAHFGNQWARNLSGIWSELTVGRFTYDATADAKVRLDYYGGLANNKFVLRNCGYFNQNTEAYTTFTRTANGVSAAPNVNLNELANIPFE